MSQRLFESLRLRDIEFRNRIWVPPMCEYAVEAHDGIATAWHMVHLGGLARGGAGAVILEATGVVPEGRISAADLGLWNDAQRDALTPIVAFMKSMGAVAGIQLAHAGRKASVHPEWGAHIGSGTAAAEEGGWQTVAPSAVAHEGLDEPIALTIPQIDALVDAFAAAARRAVDAGIELIEIHGAHGYLIHQFLSPLSNRRTDEYGGPLENRARFLRRVVDAVRAEIGEGIPLALRVSATDWLPGGVTIDDTVALVELVQDAVDLVDVSSGGIANAPIPVGPGYQVHLADELRRRTGILVGAVGMITEPFQAEQIALSGQADVVLVGREAMRDPNFPIRTALALRAEPPVPAPYRRAYGRGRSN